VAATCDTRGHGGLQRLDRHPHPRVHQVLPLLNAQPRGVLGQPEQAHPGGEGAVHLQVCGTFYITFKGDPPTSQDEFVNNSILAARKH
jgi:hypothetical protein